MDTATVPAPDAELATAATKFEKITIESDGTKKGTVIKVNGKEVSNLSSMSFYWYDSSYSPVSFSYTVRDPDPKPGTLHSCTTYRLCSPVESVYATKANASTDDLAGQEALFKMEFSSSEYDLALARHEAEGPEAVRKQWAQIK